MAMIHSEQVSVDTQIIPTEIEPSHDWLDCRAVILGERGELDFRGRELCGSTASSSALLIPSKVVVIIFCVVFNISLLGRRSYRGYCVKF